MTIQVEQRHRDAAAAYVPPPANETEVPDRCHMTHAGLAQAFARFEANLSPAKVADEREPQPGSGGVVRDLSKRLRTEVSIGSGTISQLRLDAADMIDRLAQPTEALRDVAAERARQISNEGWTPEHDDEHGEGEMAAAAAAYAFSAYLASTNRYLAADPLGFWPWAQSSWKPTTPRRDLIKAAALILAEIERLDRAALSAPLPKGGEAK